MRPVSLFGEYLKHHEGFPGGSVVNVGDAGKAGSISGSERSPGEAHGSPLQYSCLGNPTNRGVYQATVHRVTESQTQPSTRACLRHLDQTLSTKDAFHFIPTYTHNWEWEVTRPWWQLSISKTGNSWEPGPLVSIPEYTYCYFTGHARALNPSDPRMDRTASIGIYCISGDYFSPWECSGYQSVMINFLIFQFNVPVRCLPDRMQSNKHIAGAWRVRKYFQTCSAL